MPAMHRRLVVAIPVCNEADRIAACLRALNTQRHVAVDRIVLLLNNCTDSTAEIVNALKPRLAMPCDLFTCTLRGAEATAGFARSMAMRHAARNLLDHDVLMTTDADGEVAPNWISENLLALDHGADAVCGCADIDLLDAAAIPAHLHADDVRECRLGALLDEMSSLLDPDPQDPWPRHTQHSGASIAVTVAAWRKAGGMPPVPTGEDRAFVENLRRIDARIRHANTVRVTVSGRTLGRAVGGMADTIRRRMIQQDEFADCTIEPAADRYRRASAGAHFRAAWHAQDIELCADIAATLGVAGRIVTQALALPYFGQAWAALEQDCPLLLQRRVRFTELAGEIEIADRLCAEARRAAGATPSNLVAA